MAKRRARIDSGLFSATDSGSQQDSKPAKQQKEPEKAKPIKVTIYLDPEVADRIDEAQLRLKRITGKRGHDVSKSIIVETALRLAFEDLEEAGEESLLAVAMKRG
ncbi:MAG TPA: hypothetical protein VLL52_19655 [Anaerolineae bacterium]|nr:hypothetical protein [Anaerolineae bacterium]